MTFQEVHTRRRKLVESKHHGAVQELTSEQQRFSWTEVMFSLRKNGGYICSSLGGKSVLVVWQADENLIVYGIFQNHITCIFSMFEYIFGVDKGVP